MLFFPIFQKEGSGTSTTATLSSTTENKVSPDEDASQGSFVKSPAMSETSKVVQGTLDAVHQNFFFLWKKFFFQTRLMYVHVFLNL